MKIPTLPILGFIGIIALGSCSNTAGTKNNNQAGAPVLPAQSSQPATAQNTATNPAHGQPGHRCDIAVGAPLNSADIKVPQAQPVQYPSAQAPAATTVTPAQAGVSAGQPVAAGTNPPHGQPNHRCDIAVGAPLNSPAKQQPQVTVNPQPAAMQAATPVAPGMNPAHGQPGHDCSIPVGQPLKKQ
jgi:hypothetical protein